jgi:UDP-glucose 4-epimerase
VLELVHAFEQATGRRVPYSIVERRPGDVAQYWAAAELARRVLDWRATRTLHDMCADGWRWQQGNPGGYQEALTRS